MQMRADQQNDHLISNMSKTLKVYVWVNRQGCQGKLRSSSNNVDKRPSKMVGQQTCLFSSFRRT